MYRRYLFRATACALTILSGCQSAYRSTKPLVPLFDDMGQHRRKVATPAPLAQCYFDQGLTWAYAFNHDEAIRSFTECTRQDPECAMAWWGIALCNGPHINNPIVPPEREKAAYDAIRRALAHQHRATTVERDLITALATRYAHPQPADRRPLDQAYARAMRKVWRKHHQDPDVGTLYAEAMMDLSPWDLWTQDKQPKPGTREILRTLEQVLTLDPQHPGANHLYIHVVEASADPSLANDSADRLRRLVPVSGHLLHMPSHIDVLTGRWALAAEQNEQAIEADRMYQAISPNQGFYRLYMAHNHHMLSFASMMQGRAKVAIRSAREVVAGVPEDYLRANAALMDPYMGAVYDALKRFGRWDEILAEPAPPEYLLITTAMWRFTRALAHAAKSDVRNAENEKSAFLAAADNVPTDALMAINPAHKILSIAKHMLNGEIAYRTGEIDLAVAELRNAIEIEDSLLYMEPPEWVQPVRHTLGAVLLESGRHTEAEVVYRQDLTEWPENGWSLYGLSRCLRARGADAEAAQIEARYNKVWSLADTPISSSCLCVPKT